MNEYLRILNFVRPYWKRVFASVSSTFLSSLFNGFSIYLFIPLLDMLFNPQKLMQSQGTGESVYVPEGITAFFTNLKDQFLDYIFGGGQMDALLKICIIVFLAFFLKNFFGYLQSYIMSSVEEGVIRDIRNSVYRHLHELPLGYFTNERTGDLISRITNDVALVNGGISALFVTMIRDPLLIIVFLALALSISWQLVLISLVVFPFVLSIIGWIAVRLHRERGISQERLADITSILQETISGVKLVKAFGMEEFETKKFKKETQRYFSSLVKITRMRDLSSPTTEVLSVIAGVFIIWYGGTQVLVHGTLTASEFIGFLLIIFQLMPPVKELTSINNRIKEASAAAKRIFEILDMKPSITDDEKAEVLGAFNNSIEFRDVSFSYETNDIVLDGVSLSVQKGEVLAIVGPSGSGKTTLVDLIPRFYDPLTGSIHIDGTDLQKLTVRSLRDKIGIVTQETILFNDTVRNNIAYGLEDCPLEKIISAAKAANAHDFIMAMPEQYENIIGERGVKLSGGERQRLSLARAILKNPPILILDEATSALDTESEILVQEAINHLMEGRTSIVIAHRLSTIQHADRIIVLDRGKIIEAGTHGELIDRRDGLYRKLYDLQFRV